MVAVTVAPLPHRQCPPIGVAERTRATPGCTAGVLGVGVCDGGKEKIYRRYSLAHRRQKLATITAVPRETDAGKGIGGGAKAGARKGVLGRHRNSKGPALCNSAACACAHIRTEFVRRRM